MNPCRDALPTARTRIHHADRSGCRYALRDHSVGCHGCQGSPQWYVMAYFSLSSNKSLGSFARRFRFSKRNPARNVSMSLIGGTTKGDSNSFEAGFEAEERRFCGAPRGDAPKRTQVELLDIISEEPLLSTTRRR